MAINYCLQRTAPQITEVQWGEAHAIYQMSNHLIYGDKLSGMGKVMAGKTKSLSKQRTQELASENINLARREAWRLQRTTDIDYDTLERSIRGLCKAAII